MNENGLARPGEAARRFRLNGFRPTQGRPVERRHGAGVSWLHVQLNLSHASVRRMQPARFARR
jgi:hypothetical protein